MNRAFISKGVLATILLSVAWVQTAGATCAQLSDYCNSYNLPPAQSASTNPNILVIMDNSGSMNTEAYEDAYSGGPNCNSFDIAVSQSRDDAEEMITGSHEDPGHVWYGSDDLDLGGWNDNFIWVGVRFQDILVPQGATIARAYIQFTAKGGTADATNLVIWGQDADDTVRFSNNDFNLSARPRTGASVAWSNVPAWSNNQRDNATRTPDLTTIVQEIVNRDGTEGGTGWDTGNAMTFLFAGTGKRDAYAYSSSNYDKAPVLHIELDTGDNATNCTVYYGYFNPDGWYTYETDPDDGESKFMRDDTSGDWYGNWLNWMTMRRLDVVRKVMVGGKQTGATVAGSGEATLVAENTSDRDWTRSFTDTDGLTPYSGSHSYKVDNAILKVDGSTSYSIKIKKDRNFPGESDDFLNGSIAGVIQKVGDQARWTNAWFYEKEGGGVARPMGSSIQDIVDDMSTRNANTWTPLAETFYVGMHYYMQKAVSGWPEGAWYNGSGASQRYAYKYGRGSANDPFYQNGVKIECAKSFVILLTDGASTQDQNSDMIAYIGDYDGDGNDPGSYGSSGSDYLDDLALKARTTDLRDDLDGEQNIILYTVYAFGDETNARQLLRDAARNGGFVDQDGDNKPDGDYSDPAEERTEWDQDGDGEPDTYFEASDGYLLEAELLNALSSILARAASATAVSVLSTRGEGEGTLVQAYFKPKEPVGIQPLRWIGYLQSLWVDPFGYTREDSEKNYTLDLEKDNIIQFYLDEATNETRAYVFEPSSGNPYPSQSTPDPSKSKSLDEIIPIWEGGDLLADRYVGDRKIMTYVGTGSEPDPQFTEFDTSNQSAIEPFLGVKDNETCSPTTYLGVDAGERANNLISFVRGVEDGSSEYQGSPNLRSRTMDDGRLWKLGDIVNSTPLSISKPTDNYGLIYDDVTYHPYLRKYLNRETVVYVGGNDGMLHAFSSGVYLTDNQTFVRPDQAPGYLSEIPDTMGIGSINIGDELWAYVPKNLLPHLKWMADPDYTEECHATYVDIKPRVFDAPVFDSDDKHPNGWGTVLVCGMNYGGNEIAAGGGTYKSTYFAIDVTNPRDPELMWELDPSQFPDLGFTTNRPAILSVGTTWSRTSESWHQGEWYLAFGSGPSEFGGKSTNEAHFYIIDLKTGGKVAYRDFAVGLGQDSFTNVAVSLDKGLNYNVDAIYFGVNYSATGTWSDRKSLIRKITIPQLNTEFDPRRTNYDTDVNNWTVSTVMDVGERWITSPVTLSNDSKNNVWIFFGSGRYVEQADKFTEDENLIFGIKDPFFNGDRDNQTGCYLNYGAACPALTINDLYDAGVYSVHEDRVEGLSSGSGTFTDLLEEARDAQFSGWYRRLCEGILSDTGSCTSSGPSERILSKPALLGGILLVPTFSPNIDPCGYGGSGRLFALFYETGTAFRKSIIGKTGDEFLDVMFLGQGLPPDIGIHVGREKGGTAFIQESTGEIVRIQFDTAFPVKSTPIYWKEGEKL